MRPKGTIYVCRDRLVTSHVTQSEAALVTYQPPGMSPCVGFDCDSTGRAIEAKVLAGSWYLAQQGFRRVGPDGQHAAFREAVLRFPLFIHGPGEVLLGQFRRSGTYFRDIGLHKLRERYGRGSAPPVVPEVIGYYPRKGDFDFTMLAGYIADKCDFATLWTLPGSGFGWHFIVLNGRRSFDVEFLPKLAEQFDCDWLEVRPTALPRY